MPLSPRRLPRSFALAILGCAAAIVLVMGIHGIKSYLENRHDPVAGRDFYGYYTPACLVRNHQSADIYEEALRDVDPLSESADPATNYAQTARARGIPSVPLYDYPPTLADLLVPFTFLSPPTALAAWLSLSALALICTGILLARSLQIKTLGPTLLLLAALSIYHPTLDCFYMGQISLLLLLMLVAAISLDAHGRTHGAAFLFALAAAIKLTPLIVVVPLLALRDWKTLRSLALWLAAMAAALVLINGWEPLGLYFLHELPRMSSAALDTSNRSLGVALQVALQPWVNSPPWVWSWIAKIASLLVLLAAAWMSRSALRPNQSVIENRIELFSIFLFLSCCLSPVSWAFSYPLAAPELALLAKRIWCRQSSALEAILWLLFLLAISTHQFEVLRIATPLLGVALCLVALRRLQWEGNTTEHPGAPLSMPAA